MDLNKFSGNTLTKNKKALGILGVGIVTILGGIFFAMPYLKVNDLKQALEKKDAAAVSEHIDFPNLKANLKSMLHSQLLAKAMKEQQAGNPFGMMGIGMGSTYLDNVLDQFVSPEGIALAFQASQSDPKMNSEKLASDIQTQANISMGYENFNQFAIKVQDKKNPDVSAHLIFSRQSLLDWKVSNLRISDAMMQKN